VFPAPLRGAGRGGGAGRREGRAGRVSRVHLPFSSASDVSWAWSRPDAAWIRAHGEVPHTLEDGSPVSATNVVIQLVEVTAGQAYVIIVDGFSTYFLVCVLVVGILTVLCSMNYLKVAGHESGEYWALVVWSIVGQCLMASANHLLIVFLGVEMASKH